MYVSKYKTLPSKSGSQYLKCQPLRTGSQFDFSMYCQTYKNLIKYLFLLYICACTLIPKEMPAVKLTFMGQFTVLYKGILVYLAKEGQVQQVLGTAWYSSFISMSTIKDRCYSSHSL